MRAVARVLAGLILAGIVVGSGAAAALSFTHLSGTSAGSAEGRPSPVVATSTPSPIPAPPTSTAQATTLPQATTTPQPVELATPTATPTGSIRITGLQVSPSPDVPSMGTITLTYTIDNETGTSQDAFLGATVYSEQIAADSFSDPGNDVVVTLAPGTQEYTRQFFLPHAADGQWFDVLVSASDSTHTHLYDMERYSHLFGVGSS